MSDEQNRLMKDALLGIGNALRQHAPNMDATIQYIQGEWDDLSEKERSAAATKQEREDAKRHMEALAKGLPVIATGLRDAVKGFEKGDAFAGSAAIMDICSSLASTVGTMAGAAGGPPGALIGAVFSIVSMILKMFVKEQKSLTAQIEEVIRSIKAESKIQNLHVALSNIEAFRNAVTTEGVKWKLEDYESMLNPLEGSTITAIRKAAEWLDEPKNQELSLWGHVLAAQCDAYVGLMQSLTIAVTSLDVSTLSDKGVGNIAKLNAMFKANDPIQRRFLQQIKPAAQSRGIFWHIGTLPGNTYPDSGHLYVHDSPKGEWKRIDDNCQRVVTVAKTHTANIADPNPYLAIFALEPIWDKTHYRPDAPYRKNNHTRGLFGSWPLTKHTGWMDIDGLHEVYDICATRGAKEHEVYVYTANGDKINRYTHGGEHSENEGRKLRLCEDVKFTVPEGRTVGAVCAVAEPKAFSDEKDAFGNEAWVVYGGCEVKEWQSIVGEYECHRHDGTRSKNEWHRISISKLDDKTYLWENFSKSWKLTVTDDPTKLKLGDDYEYKGQEAFVSVIRHQGRADGDVVGLKGNQGNVYDRVAFWREIRVYYSSELEGSIRPPVAGFNGIRADSRYLWVFNRFGIACVTHASVKQYLLKKIAEPAWIKYVVPKEMGGFFGGSESEGLIDISPCDDGSLVAVWSNCLVYNLVPQIDRKARTFVVEGTKKDHYGHSQKTNGWVQEPDINAHRVLKQPIFCWSIFERNMTALE